MSTTKHRRIAGRKNADLHASVLNIIAVVTQHVSSKNHACRPCLAAAARREVFVDLERRWKQAAKVESSVAGRLVLGQRGQVLVKGGKVETIISNGRQSRR